MEMNALFSSTQPIVISCSPHIAPYLKREIEAMGFQVESETITTIHTRGTFADCIKLNLCLRTANHVFFLIKKFTATSLQQLYDEVKSIAWEEILFADGYFSIH